MSREQELRDQIIEKAWADASFKEQLIADPKSAIRDAFGIEIPAHFNVQVLEETQDNYYLVIPENPQDVARMSYESLGRWR
ncbi:NHLP leader peptide family RiPP precursor [Paenibacillus sp. GSMTC-2017]|uniref:NHLP leader peptide family RiPP precursor n=1 Tax=Paenibacillus sp. GSMTC-2017 TaxID=2794350 RepID=UPI0018D9AD76|nr:NHLP leader peptide family RiPP precursor [Paenibacillus sp. GSMTC-2017]MBH5319999.1 NHLP leader peptide family RiPP precursor [Paenibacillus sp. GSMTC-2017]